MSQDGNDQKNCRLWLDAGDLTDLADGDSVVVWYDKSLSSVRDSAYRDTLLSHKYTYPIFRNSPSASINGKPVISFESGGMLGIGNWLNGSDSEDLNSNPTMITTYQQTIFIAFRTSTDVETRQILWEEGGAERGLNIYINDNNVFIGAYDVNSGDDDYGSGSVPGFGFTYKKLPVQANTTYILAYKYDVPTDNTLILNNTTTSFTGLTGSLNGQPFPNIMTRGDNSENSYCGGCANGVGGIWKHQDPIGIGGVNQGSYNETGRIYNGHDHDDPVQNFYKRNISTGTHLFKGRIAEIVYYAYALNVAEQIIVENYLAAKYFANVIANDKYIYESSFGNGVIGIGRQQVTPIVEKNVSQGDNLFEISVTNMANAFLTTPQYLLVGNNNGALSWTSQNTPDSASIQRLRRIWRWDQTGGDLNASKTIKIKLDSADIARLPPLPTGYTKYGVLIGDRNQQLPNFSQDFSQIIELTGDSDGLSANIPISDGNYLTICAIKPVVQFRLSSDFAIEGNTGTDLKTAEVFLNYIPAQSTQYEVGFTFIDGSATSPNDYTWISSYSPLYFSSGASSKLIPFEIVNDVTVVNDLPVETFSITLTSANNGLTIGAQNTLIYSIYDNDPPPKVTFQEANASYSEGAGEVHIPVSVVGSLTDPATATIQYIPGSGTASINEDFTLVSPQIMNFSPSVLTDHFVLQISEDILDEDDEYFTLKIINTTGDLGFDETLNIEMNVQIIDNDLPPEASFVSAESEGYESISEPQIFVKLSAKSAKEITVPFSLTGGTATNDAISPGGDYTAAPEGGTLIFQPGDSVRALYQDNITGENHIIVYGNDTPNEPDETIIFKLDGIPTNASLGSILQHTYTIKEYTEYEWLGVAGVGKLPDNTIWMVPDAATSGSDIPNLSPRPIQILQNDSNRTPQLTTREAGLNNKKLIQFDGINDLLVPGNPSAADEGQSSLIQTAAFYDSKSIFFVFIPEKVNDPTPQCIFEAGAQRTGMSIYIINNTLYFQAWGWQDNLNPHVLWGLDPTNQTGIAYTEYTGLVAGQPYIISCHYQNTQSGIPNPSLGGLSLFVNGELVDTYSGPVDRLQNTVGGAAIGSVSWQGRFHTTKFFTNTNSNHTIPSPTKTGTSNFFNGKMGDFLYYNEPKMNLARNRIITNYLSARYNVPLAAGAQVFDLDYADNTPSATLPAFNHEVAGIGKISGDIHGDSQGEGELRIRNPQFNGSESEGFLVWGNNNESLTNTWPVSSAILPSGIQERSAKVWRIMANPVNGTNTADFYIRYSTSQNAPAFSANPDLLKLLVSHDPDDFTTASVYPVSFINSGHIAQFNSVPVTNGMYIALGNSSAVYPLPVELLSFTAKLLGETVDLNWATSSEINNDYFVIERASDDLKWKKISTIAGAGNSNTKLYYNEKDRNPLPGISYYRLKQVDYDGKYKYSDVVSVVNHISDSGDDVYLFPNPSSGNSVFIRIPHAYNRLITQVVIYNISGERVWQKRLETGGSIFELNYGDLPAGVYIVHISNDALNESNKLVVQ